MFFIAFDDITIDNLNDFHVFCRNEYKKKKMKTISLFSNDNIELGTFNSLYNILILASMMPDTVQSVENNFAVPSTLAVVVTTGTNMVVSKLVILGLSSNRLLKTHNNHSTRLLLVLIEIMYSNGNRNESL